MLSELFWRFLDYVFSQSTWYLKHLIRYLLFYPSDAMLWFVPHVFKLRYCFLLGLLYWWDFPRNSLFVLWCFFSQYFSLIFLYYFYFFAEFHFNILFWLSYFIGFLVLFMFSRDSFMSLCSSLNILINILLRSLGFYLIHSYWSCYYGIRNFWRSCGPMDFNVYCITMLRFIHLFLSLCLSFFSAVFFQLKYFQCSSRSRLW